MGRKIFVSYKYADDDVENLSWGQNSTVRDYVTEFEEILEESDNIYKGESDDEDLSNLEEDTIWEKLKDRIYDSSVTVIFISPGMVKKGVKERDQWIPWEISYSLKEVSRKNKNGDPVTSRSNAMLAVVLPDGYGSYDYYLEKRSCCTNNCVLHHSEKLFPIIKSNKFNIKEPNKSSCQSGQQIWYGDYGYIVAVKWEKFIKNYNQYVDAACERQDRIEEYEICKEVSDTVC